MFEGVIDGALRVMTQIGGIKPLFNDSGISGVSGSGHHGSGDAAANCPGNLKRLGGAAPEGRHESGAAQGSQTQGISGA
jgi:hypothetical protein